LNIDKYQESEQDIALLDRLIINSINTDKLIEARNYLSKRLQIAVQQENPKIGWYKIDELMTFFLEKKDFEFAITVYNEFLKMEIMPALSRRRLVALLIKTNKLVKARELSSNSKAFFT
jgi:hypothetical protein